MFNKDQALTELFNSYSKDIFHYSLSLLKDYDDAKDAVQDVFVKFIKSRDTFRGECSYKTWLLTITRNYCFKKLNGRAKSPDNVDELKLNVAEPKFEDQISLQDALSKLNKEDYELIYLREFACYSYAEIALILGISVGNLKIKLFRVRQKLRSYLK